MIDGVTKESGKNISLGCRERVVRSDVKLFAEVSISANRIDIHRFAGSALPVIVGSIARAAVGQPAAVRPAAAGGSRGSLLRNSIPCNHALVITLVGVFCEEGHLLRYGVVRIEAEVVGKIF